jgi:hypothetical protein
LFVPHCSIKKTTIFWPHQAKIKKGLFCDKFHEYFSFNFRNLIKEFFFQQIFSLFSSFCLEDPFTPNSLENKIVY